MAVLRVGAGLGNEMAVERPVAVLPDEPFRMPLDAEAEWAVCVRHGFHRLDDAVGVGG